MEHLGEGLELQILGEQDDLAVVHRMLSADGCGNGVDEGVQAAQGKYRQTGVADDLKDQFGNL